MGCAVIVSGLADDHVHVLVHYPSAVSLSAVVQRLKGSSSHECNQRRQLTARLRWQVGYWAESISPQPIEGLIRYISNQRRHHNATAKSAERWELQPLSDPPLFL